VRRGLGSLGEAIKELLRHQQLEQREKEHAAMRCWAEAVGPENARHSQPEGVINGVMTVTAISPLWAQALQLMKPKILDRLEQLVGPGVVRDLRFGAVRRRPPRPAPSLPPPSPLRSPSPAQLDAVKLSSEQQEHAACLRQQAADAQLGQLLERGYLGLVRLRRFRQQQGWRPCPRCGRPYHGPGRWCVLCAGKG